jgi:hypothetical protein
MNTRFKFPLAGRNRQPYYCCQTDCCGFCNSLKMAREAVVSFNGVNYSLPSCCGTCDNPNLSLCICNNGNVGIASCCNWADLFAFGTVTLGGTGINCNGVKPVTLALSLNACRVSDQRSHLTFPVVTLSAALTVGGNWHCSCFGGSGSQTLPGQQFFYRNKIPSSYNQNDYCCVPTSTTNQLPSEDCLDWSNVPLYLVAEDSSGQIGSVCTGANCSFCQGGSYCLIGLLNPPATATIVDAY